MSHIEYKHLDFFGYPNYYVGDDGSIWVYRTGDIHRNIPPYWKKKKLRPTKYRGYRRISLHNKQGRKEFMVHHLVLTAFIGPKPANMEGCHNDNNPANNTLSNLRWDTRRNNSLDRFTHNTQNLAKLTPDQVLLIREKFSKVNTKIFGETMAFYRKHALIYGVSKTTIKRVVKKLTWGHI